MSLVASLEKIFPNSDSSDQEAAHQDYMRIKSLSLGGDRLAHRIPPDPATYLLINGGQIIYCGATINLLQRIYKHLSKGLIPRDKRGNWMTQILHLSVQTQRM